MRVTNSMLVGNFMNNLNNNLNKLDKLQYQMATGRKYAHISDDPVSLIYSQQARQKLNRLEHYMDTTHTAQDWIKQVETSVMELNKLIQSAYEACVDAATDVKSPSDKTNASEYLGQLRDQIVSSLNGAFGTKYVFGGYNNTGHIDDDGTFLPPFRATEDGRLIFNECDLTDYDSSDPTNPNNAVIASLKGDVLSFEVGPGIMMPVTINGIDIAMYNADGDNLYGLLDDLYQTVKSGAPADEISAFIPKLQEAQSHLLAKVAELGGRTNRLDILTARYEQDELNYTQMKSDAEDADQAEVIMNYKMAEAVYKAALSSGAYIIQPTLMDFLR